MYLVTFLLGLPLFVDGSRVQALEGSFAHLESALYGMREAKTELKEKRFERHREPQAYGGCQPDAARCVEGDRAGIKIIGGALPPPGHPDPLSPLVVVSNALKTHPR